MGQVPQVKLYLYDFSKKSGIHIEDGRVSGSYLLPIKAGYLVTTLSVFGLKKVHFLNAEGSFVDNIRIEEFKNWPENVQIIQMHPGDPTCFYISYERATFDEPETKEVFLGRVDVDNQNFEEIFVYPKKKSEHRAYWAKIPTGFLFVNVTSGTVIHFNNESFEKTTLLSAMPERESAQVAQLKKIGSNRKIPSFLMYEQLIPTRSAQFNSFNFRRNKHLPDDTEIIECYKITDTGMLSKTKNRLHVFSFNGKSIYFNVIDKVFYLD